MATPKTIVEDDCNTYIQENNGVFPVIEKCKEDYENPINFLRVWGDQVEITDTSGTSVAYNASGMIGIRII